MRSSWVFFGLGSRGTSPTEASEAAAGVEPEGERVEARGEKRTRAPVVRKRKQREALGEGRAVQATDCALLDLPLELTQSTRQRSLAEGPRAGPGREQGLDRGNGAGALEDLARVVCKAPVGEQLLRLCPETQGILLQQLPGDPQRVRRSGSPHLIPHRIKFRGTGGRVRCFHSERLAPAA